jgi:hypothetical protein
MSLAIEIDDVEAVLLADGWHRCEFYERERDGEQVSSFTMDSYEFLNAHPNPDRDPMMYHKGGQGGICSTGFLFIEDDQSGRRIAGPLSAILAVRSRA